MARVTLSAVGAAIVADATGLATELGGGSTAANFIAIGNLLVLLGQRKDLSGPALNLLTRTDAEELSNL